MFSEIAIIGGSDYDPPDDSGQSSGGHFKDVEVISITKDSISHLNSSIPSLPKKLSALRGAQLSNGDLVLSGGCTMSRYEDVDCDYINGRWIQSRSYWIEVEVCNNEYHYYKQGSNQWTMVATMKNARRNHSSVWMDGCLLTTGGDYNDNRMTSSQHEEFLLNEGVNERKEMPIALKCHTAIKFGHQKMIVCGGKGESVSNPFSK